MTSPFALSLTAWQRAAQSGAHKSLLSECMHTWTVSAGGHGLGFLGGGVSDQQLSIPRY